MTRMDFALLMAIALLIALAASQSVNGHTVSALLDRIRLGGMHASPVPESSAALLGALGLLAASRLAQDD